MACGEDLGADLVGFAGVEPGVEAEGLLPVVAGLAGVAFGVVYAGEAVVSAGLLVLVANLAGEDERGGPHLQERGHLAHVGVPHDHVQPAVSLGIGVGFVPGVDDGTLQLKALQTLA